jgi:hypothetical protein
MMIDLTPRRSWVYDVLRASVICAGEDAMLQVMRGPSLRTSYGPRYRTRPEDALPTVR